ncbi:acyl-CoA thioesterase [Enhygromyxa salina]|nr:hypothetical protein [Enhygromyxa salina]
MQGRVRVGVAASGRTSLDFGFRMLPMDRDLDHARGVRTIVHVDPTTLEPKPWSDEFRAAMADGLGPAAAVPVMS